MIKAVIFDKDGVLVLTEEIYFRAWRDAMKKFGANKEFTWEHHYQYIGVPNSETFFAIREEYGMRVSYDEFVNDYRNRYREIFEIEGLEAVKGVRELLDALKKENIPFAISTAGSLKSSEMILRKVGIFDYFKIIVTSDDYSRGKPDPEPFLLAAKKLGVNPHECVVIGDAINDVLAAKSAGMKVIAITDKSYIEDPELASPDLEVKEFKEITLEMIKSF